MPTSVEVTAPSRLHFGLFAFDAGERRYGGVGAMIAEPALRLRASDAEQFSASGRYAVRVARFASAYAASFGLSEPPACRIEVVAAPDEHHGLGLGTQLGMSVAAALAAVEGRNDLTTTQLAVSVGRGARSAVGAHGFRHGGLIVDGGKAAGEPVGRLDGHAALPPEWRFVLARPTSAAGLAGGAEVDAFGRLPPPPASVTERLVALAKEELLPAAKAGAFERFSSSLHEYNVTAGECFAAIQGGPFANPRVAEVIRRLQAIGCVGCGQSSWGPTVFGLAEDESEAERLVACLAEEGVEACITPPSNAGAAIE